MRLFVGTMYSGENEYKECMQAIHAQTFTDYDEYLFTGLSLKDAHHTLFKAFLNQGEKYEVLAKVDADTVICNNDLFEKVVEKFEQNPWMEVFAIAVKDFFCGHLIQAGMAFYRNTVKWNFDKDTLFVDIPETSKDHYVYDQVELAPAAIHCKNPLPFHAFHYGVHRGLKSIAKIHSSGHWKFLQETWHNFNKVNDPRIGLAVLGAELVYAGKCKKEIVDYTNPSLSGIFDRYKDLTSDEIRRKIITMRVLNWGFLPGDLRRKVIRKIHAKDGNQ
jgi:hypothetical protein